MQLHILQANWLLLNQYCQTQSALENCLRCPQERAAVASASLTRKGERAQQFAGAARRGSKQSFQAAVEALHISSHAQDRSDRARLPFIFSLLSRRFYRAASIALQIFFCGRGPLQRALDWQGSLDSKLYSLRVRAREPNARIRLMRASAAASSGSALAPKKSARRFKRKISKIG